MKQPRTRPALNGNPGRLTPYGPVVGGRVPPLPEPWDPRTGLV